MVEVDTSPYDKLAPRVRRRLLVRALVRGFLSATLLVVAYYLLPLDRTMEEHTVFLLIVVLTAFAIVLVYQVRAVINANYPLMRAIDTLFILVPMLLLSYAAVYYSLSKSSAANFTQPMTRTDSLYFTVTTFATVGYGDIAPVSEVARVIAITQMLANLAALGLGVRVIIGAVRIGQQRKT